MMLKSKKGQMFLILGVLIVIFLISIRLAVQPPQDISVDEAFDPINIRNEFANVQKFSDLNRTQIVDNLGNFSGFIDNKMDERGIGFEEVFVLGWVEPTSNGTEVNMTVTVGNFIGSQITDVNITLKNSTETHDSLTFSSINDDSDSTGNITFDMLAESKTLLVDYKVNGALDSSSYSVSLKEQKTIVIGVFDLEFSILDKTIQEKFVDIDHR